MFFTLFLLDTLVLTFLYYTSTYSFHLFSLSQLHLVMQETQWLPWFTIFLELSEDFVIRYLHFLNNRGDLALSHSVECITDRVTLHKSQRKVLLRVQYFHIYFDCSPIMRLRPYISSCMPKLHTAEANPLHYQWPVAIVGQ